MISKKILVPVLVVAAISAGAIFKVSLAQAATNTPRSGFVSYLAQKLGVEPAKVETAFSSYHSEQQATRQKEMTDRLTTYLSGLVKEGKITDSQKNAILAKHLELQKTRQSADWSTKTPAERKTVMEKQRTDLENWAKSQGIDTQYLQFGFGGGMMGGRGGKGMGLGRGMMGDFDR